MISLALALAFYSGNLDSSDSIAFFFTGLFDMIVMLAWIDKK